jgi:carboxypeptidase C (cathepsin A)
MAQPQGVAPAGAPGPPARRNPETSARSRRIDKPSGDKGAEKAAAAPAAPRKFVTHHRFTAGGVDMPYTATAEDIDLKDRDGKPTGRFFTISYIAEGVKRQEDRPITFFFNGGPGSASVWLPGTGAIRM